LWTAAQAGQRVVLMEEFTATWCGPCEYAGQAMSQLIDDYPGQIAAFQIHVADNYAIPWGEGTRANFYGVWAVPTVEVDARLEHIGATTVQETYNEYLAMVQQRWNTPTKVSIALGGESLGGNDYQISARVGLDASGVAKTVRVHMVEVLDHYPAGVRHRNCLMQHPAYQVIDLVPGASQVISWTITLTGPSVADPNNVKIIAWAEQPVGSAPGNVYQATVMDWPFTPLSHAPGDVDGDGDVDLNDLTALLVAYGTCAGDPGWNSYADFNDDGCVTLDDLTTLLTNYSP